MELGKEREVIRYVGVAECQVIGANLTREQYKEKVGYDPGYDPIYTRESKTGDKAIKLVFYLREVTTNHIFPLTFFMEEREAKTGNNNTKYVNDKCQSTVALMDWFTQYPHRPAYHGEPELLTFIRVFTSPALKWYGNYPNSGSYPLDETKIIFQENFGPINDIITRYNKWTVGILTGIRSAETGDYQDVFNRAFLKGTSVKQVSQMAKGVDPATLTDDVREFIKATEGPHGYKNYFGDSYQFRRYEKENNLIANTNSAIIQPNTAPDDDLPF